MTLLTRIILSGLLLVILPYPAWAALININTAPAQELESITGVGEVIAGRIVEYRSANGPFKTIEEIKNVKGIGDATFLKMKAEITIGEVSSGNEANPSGTNTSNANGTNSTETTEQISTAGNFSANDSASVHANQISLSMAGEKLSWQITAGRSRRVLVGAPIILEANTVTPAPAAAQTFSWSFGDGGSGAGPAVSHLYHFPGVYQVVVNGRAGDEQAVARTVVTVEAPRLGIKLLPYDQAVQITNQAAAEVNLGGFRIAADSTTFLTLPPDTIIAAHSLITVPLPGFQLAGVLGVNFSTAVLYSPIGQLAAGEEIMPSEPKAPVTVRLFPTATETDLFLPDEATATGATTSTSGVTSIELTPPHRPWWQKLLNWLKS